MAAKFPTQAPTVYTDKSTSNDVGDTSHWDGADANQAKAEIVAIAGKVGINGDTNPASLDYRVGHVESRKEAKTGNGTLPSGTSTTVTNANVTTSSRIAVQARSAGFQQLNPIAYVSAINSGSFVLTHGNAAGTETFDYFIVT